MSLLNINGGDDPTYRYKMVKLESQQAGRGNGCFTILSNIKEVANSINQPHIVLLKFIGNTAGVSINEDKLSINGTFENESLISSIYEYVNFCVICKNCNIPEVIPTLEGKKKKKRIEMKCSACNLTYTLEGKNKNQDKCVDLLIKYLENNEWKVNKGTIVENNLTSDFNPFN